MYVGGAVGTTAPIVPTVTDARYLLVSTTGTVVLIGAITPTVTNARCLRVVGVKWPCAAPVGIVGTTVKTPKTVKTGIAAPTRRHVTIRMIVTTPIDGGSI